MNVPDGPSNKQAPPRAEGVGRANTTEMLSVNYTSPSETCEDIKRRPATTHNLAMRFKTGVDPFLEEVLDSNDIYIVCDNDAPMTVTIRARNVSNTPTLEQLQSFDVATSSVNLTTAVSAGSVNDSNVAPHKFWYPRECVGYTNSKYTLFVYDGVSKALAEAWQVLPVKLASHRKTVFAESVVRNFLKVLYDNGIRCPTLGNVAMRAGSMQFYVKQEATGSQNTSDITTDADYALEVNQTSYTLTSVTFVNTIPSQDAQSSSHSSSDVWTIVGATLGGIVALIALAIMSYYAMTMRAQQTSKTVKNE